MNNQEIYSPDGELWIVVGLGNVGPTFKSSKHNVGFECIDALAKRHQISVRERRQHAVLGQGEVEGCRVVLAKPRTFVNRSGKAIVYLRDRFGVPPDRTLIVYDDMDLPLGKLRLRPAGASGGHNGMNSIIDSLGTENFPRLRIGIGRPDQPDVIAHVLGGFSEQEKEHIADAVNLAVDAIDLIMADDINTAMNRFN